MVFIDNLAYSLFALTFAGLLILYLVVTEWFVFMRKDKNYSNYTARLEGAKVPLLVLGIYMIIMAMWGQFTWPLPGSYNILYYDPLVSFGMIVLALGLAVHYRVKFEYVGFFGLLIGIMTIIYGWLGYSIGISKEPVVLLAMFALFGISGIFSYPVALIMEKLPGLEKKPWIGWTICLAIFCLAILGASILSGVIGMSAIGGHLITP